MNNNDNRPVKPGQKVYIIYNDNVYLGDFALSIYTERYKEPSYVFEKCKIGYGKVLYRKTMKEGYLPVKVKGKVYFRKESEIYHSWRRAKNMLLANVKSQMWVHAVEFAFHKKIIKELGKIKRKIEKWKNC